MKVSSPRTWLTIAAVAAVTGLSVNAVAQNAPVSESPRLAQAAGPGAQSGPSAERMERWAKRHAERHAQRQERLKSDLKLTPEQEPAWLAYVARTQAKPMVRPAANPGDKPWNQLTTPERIERFKTHQAERQAAMNQRLEAIQSFYGALTPEQKQVFDTRSPLRGPGMDRTKMGHRQGHGHFHGHHHTAEGPKNGPQASQQ